MAINASTNLIALQTTHALKLLDPKTSAILISIDTDLTNLCFTDQNILTCSSKNILSCYDYKGQELWKQHLGGDAAIVHTFQYHSIFGYVYANKDIRIYTQVSELKLSLDFVGKAISKVKHYQQYLAVVDDLQNNVYLFLLDDLLLQKTKPFKVFSGNNSTINDLTLKNVLATISKERELIIFDLASNQIIYQTQLESEPLALEIDLDYAYIGCVNKSIYQVKYNQCSINYSIHPTTQINKRKMLIGHLSEIKSLKLFFEDGHTYLASNSDDGQVFIWIIDGNQTTLQKKIVTLQVSKLFLLKRPYEHQVQSEEQILFKSKRLMQIKPLKKAKYTPNQLVLCKKRIQKIKLTFEESNISVQQVVDPQINAILEENQKLKELLHQLIFVNSSPCRTAQEVSQISQATANQKVLNQKITDLENRLKYYEQANQRLTAQLNDQQDQLLKEKGKLQKEKDVLASKLHSNELQIGKLLDENEKLVKTIKKIQVDIQFREENDELRKKLQECQAKLDAQKSPDKQWSSDAALGLLAQKRREEIQILTNDNQDLKQKNNELQKKLNNLLSENQQLQQIIHQQESVSQRLHSQASSIKQDKSNYYGSSQKKTNEPTPSFLVDQINSLKSELSDAKKTIEKLKKPSISKTSNSNNVSPNSKLVSQLKTTNSPQPQKNQELYKSYASGAPENDQIRDLKDKIRQLEFEKDNIAQTIRLECAQDMKQLQDKLRQEQYIQTQMLKEDQKPQQDELKKISIENQKLQKLVTRQEKEMQNMEQKLTGLLISQEDIQQSLKKEKQFQDYLKNEKAKLQEQLNDHKDDIIKLSKERQQLKEQLDQFKNDSRISNKPASQKSEVKKRG